MFPLRYLCGRVHALDDSGIILDIQGLGGIEILMLASEQDQLYIGISCTLFTRVIQGNDSMVIYGFLTKEYLIVFDALCSVSGIGAKSAMSVINTFSDYHELFSIIAQDRYKYLLNAPGIGEKSAQRIVFELKNKLKKLTKELKLNWYEQPAIEQKLTPEQEKQINHVKELLISLGYSKQEINQVIQDHSSQILNISSDHEILKYCMNSLK